MLKTDEIAWFCRSFPQKSPVIRESMRGETSQEIVESHNRGLSYPRVIVCCNDAFV